MKLGVFGQTDVGKSRSHNEDFVLPDRELGVFVVCDGMGGHAAGEVASETAATAVRDYVAEHGAWLSESDESDEAVDRARDLLREAVEHANDRVREVAKSGRGRPGMGTTCICVLVLGSKGVMGHVGDSRLYLHRGGKIYQLSEDHTYLNDAIRHGLMRREQAAASPYAHAVTRGIGMGETVCVDTLVFDVLAGDSFLLCSDGLYEYFTDHEEVASFMGAEQPEEIPVALVGMANERGGKDNISALLVRAQLDEHTAPHEVERGVHVSNALATLGYISLLSELTPEELVRVLNVFRDARFSAGQTVIKEGDSSESLFVIVAGVCEVMRGTERMATLQAGSHFGEMALLNRRPRTATVVATTDLELLALSRHDFNQFVRRDASIASKFLWKLAQSLSMRLDDLYLLRDAAADSGPRRTMPLQLLSPFQD